MIYKENLTMVFNPNGTVKKKNKNVLNSKSNTEIKSDKVNNLRSRIFNVMQYLNHPETGEPLLNIKSMRDALDTNKFMTKWAYIVHDKDPVSNNSAELKPPHVHLVIQCENLILVRTLSKVLNIPTNFIDIPKGGKAFRDCLRYLTHSEDKQKNAGKYVYPAEDVIANFDWQAESAKGYDDKADKETLDRWLLALSKGEMFLEQCKAENHLLYIKKKKDLQQARNDYVETSLVPHIRVNYYVQGEGGVGKGLLSKALARSLFPNLPDDRVFFEVGGEGCMFDGYDGQPVLIWNDFRVQDLVSALGRSKVFNIFDTAPTTAKQNIKYGSVRLLNCVNIVNCVTPYKEFLDGLAGEYSTVSGMKFEAEDKAQTYRRFPVIIPMTADTIEILINKGFIEGNRGYIYQYKTAMKFDNALARIYRERSISNDLKKQLATDNVKKIAIIHDKVKSVLDSTAELSEEELKNETAKALEKYRNVGEILAGDEEVLKQLNIYEVPSVKISEEHDNTPSEYMTDDHVDEEIFQRWYEKASKSEDCKLYLEKITDRKSYFQTLSFLKDCNFKPPVYNDDND